MQIYCNEIEILKLKIRENFKDLISYPIVSGLAIMSFSFSSIDNES